MAAYQHRTIVVGDIKTHFLEAGSGPDLVLLHGGEYGASAEITWRYNIDALAKTFHVVAPDTLGWGQTDKLYSFSDPAGLRIKHLQRFLESLGIAKAFFVGDNCGLCDPNKYPSMWIMPATPPAITYGHNEMLQ